MDLELPDELHYLIGQSEEAIVDLLKLAPGDLITFLASALYNGTWTAQHLDMLEKLIAWLTEQSVQATLPLSLLYQAGSLISSHFSSLAPIVPANLMIRLQDGDFEINSLLFICASNKLKNFFYERKDKTSFLLEFPDVSIKEFQSVKEFIETGQISRLWKKWKPDLFALMELGMRWDLKGVVSLSAGEMAKYIDLENVIELLTLSIREKLPLFEEKCLEKINQYDWGFSLHLDPNMGLILTINYFSDEMMQSFQKVQDLVNGLSCHDSLIDHRDLILMIQRSPQLFNGLRNFKTGIFFLKFLQSL